MGKEIPKLTDNWKVVTLSLIVATIFWFFNALSKNYDAHVEYPLEFQFQKDSLVIVDPLPEYLQLEVAGGGWDLLRRTTWIGAEPIVIKLDNPTEVKLYPKNNLRRIVSEQLKDINVKYILTDSVFINIEPRVSRKVIVQIDSSSIKLRDNYRVTSKINLSQDTIEITGPVSYIKQLKSPITLPLTSSEISRDFDDEIEIPLNNEDIMTSVPSIISVDFSVEEFKNITLAIPLEKQNFDSLQNIYLLDSTVNVSYWIAQSKVDQVSANDFSILADKSLIEEKDSTLSLLLLYAPEDALEVMLEKTKVKVSYAER